MRWANHHQEVQADQLTFSMLPSYRLGHRNLHLHHSHDHPPHDLHHHKSLKQAQLNISW